MKTEARIQKPEENPMMQFTPGPWKASGVNRWDISSPTPGGGQIIVAHCTSGIDNARLIAAAPELLAALESLFENCSMIHNIWGEGCNQKQADAAIAAGRVAIAKAMGKS